MRYWIVSWDCNGVEFLDEITEHHPDNWAKQHLFASTKQKRILWKTFLLKVNDYGKSKDY